MNRAERRAHRGGFEGRVGAVERDSERLLAQIGSEYGDLTPLAKDFIVAMAVGLPPLASGKLDVIEAHGMWQRAVYEALLALPYVELVEEESHASG